MAGFVILMVFSPSAVAQQKLYLTDDNGRIVRTDPDGKNPIDIVTRGVHFPYDVAVDSVERKVYWTDNQMQPHAAFVRRANLDGSDARSILAIPRFSTFQGIALDPRGRGDFDANASVNLRDFAVLQNCYSGMGLPFSESRCLFFDTARADRAIDHKDYSAFFVEFSTGR